MTKISSSMLWGFSGLCWKWTVFDCWLPVEQLNQPTLDESNHNCLCFVFFFPFIEQRTIFQSKYSILTFSVEHTASQFLCFYVERNTRKKTQEPCFWVIENRHIHSYANCVHCKFYIRDSGKNDMLTSNVQCEHTIRIPSEIGCKATVKTCFTFRAHTDRWKKNPLMCSHIIRTSTSYVKYIRYTFFIFNFFRNLGAEKLTTNP